MKFWRATSKSVRVLLFLIAFSFILTGSYFFLQNRTREVASIAQEAPIQQKETAAIIASQSELLQTYLDKTPAKGKHIIAYYSMSPLGVFDPISDPRKYKDPSKTINYLYGYIGNQFDVPEKQLLENVGFPFKHAKDFNQNDYFVINEDELNDMLTVVMEDPSLQIIGTWDQTNIFRINNSFGDTKRNIFWTQTPKDGYFDYTLLEKPAAIEKRKADKSNYDSLFQNMSRNGIQTIYKCNDTVIFIMFAVSDNAFGYTYGSNQKNSVNCGLLQNRYTILRDSQVNNEWRYWVVD